MKLHPTHFTEGFAGLSSCTPELSLIRIYTNRNCSLLFSPVLCMDGWEWGFLDYSPVYSWLFILLFIFIYLFLFFYYFFSCLFFKNFFIIISSPVYSWLFSPKLLFSPWDVLSSAVSDAPEPLWSSELQVKNSHPCKIPFPALGWEKPGIPRHCLCWVRVFLFNMLENKHYKNPYMPELPVRCLWSLLSVFVYERFMGHSKEVAVLLWEIILWENSTQIPGF